jgi:hypothetical protein
MNLKGREKMRRLAIICNELQHQERTVTEMHKIINRKTDTTYCKSIIEKDFRFLQDEFDAPFEAGDKKGSYTITKEWSFNDEVLEWINFYI